MSTEELFQHDIRVSKIIWLGGNMASQCEDLTDLIEEDPECIKQLTGVDPEDLDVESLMSELARKRREGFILLAETPVPIFLKGDTHTASWGYFTQKWFYFDDLITGAVCARLIEWQSDYYKKLRNK